MKKTLSLLGVLVAMLMLPTTMWAQGCSHPENRRVNYPKIEPTCLAPGYREMFYCYDCEHYMVTATGSATTFAEQRLEPLGHEWVDGECSRCHAKTEMRELNKDVYSGSFVQVAVWEGKYYAMGLNPVDDGLEAIELPAPEDGYLRADISRLAVIERDVDFSLLKDHNAAPRFYYHKFRMMYYDYENNIYREGIQIGIGWGPLGNRLYDQTSSEWNGDRDVQSQGYLEGTDCSDGKSYEIVLKHRSDGVIYFGIQPWDSSNSHEGLFLYYLQCAHENLVHTPSEAASCMEPATMESWYCSDCETYFADAKCHHIIDVDVYQPDAALGHLYEEGSVVCSRCGETAGIYRPVTDKAQFNAGYKYMMVGHIGDQYYVLSRPSLRPYREFWDHDTPDEELPLRWMWDNKKLTAVPVTLNDDGSITANGNDMLEFSLTCKHQVYNEWNADMGSPFYFHTPWGIITDETDIDGSITANFSDWKFENWKYVLDGSETVGRRLTLAEDGYQFFNWWLEEERDELPDNIKNVKAEENAVLMYRRWAGEPENYGTYIMAKEDGDVYFCPLNHYWNEWVEYTHPTAELMIPTLYYCASKAMPHFDGAEVAIYGDELTGEGLEKALEEVTEDEGVRVFNIDLSNVTNINVTGENMRDKVFENDAVSNNAFIIVPNESTLSGTNIIRNGQCDDVVITDGDPFVVPEQFTADDNLLQSAHASYERAMGGSSVWGTLYLPFVIKSNADVQLFKLAEVTVDGDEGVLTFEPVDEVAESTPCVFRRNTAEGGVSFDVNNVAIHPAGATLSTEVENWNMLGTFDGSNIQSYQHLVNDYGYDEEVDDDIARYYIASNQFWQSEIKTWVPPFRAWFEQQSSSNSAKSFRIFVEDNDETSILEIDANGNLNQLPKNATYDLCGRRVEKAEHGVFIIGGKKVIVK